MEVCQRKGRRPIRGIYDAPINTGGKYPRRWSQALGGTSDGRDQDFEVETETETFILGLMEPRPRPRLSFWVSWNRDRDRDFHFGSLGTETETETLSLGLVESRPRPRLLFWVSWNRDRDRDFHFGFRGIKTKTQTFVSCVSENSWLATPWCHGTKDKVESTMYFCEHKQINVLIQKNKGNSSLMKEHKLL